MLPNMDPNGPVVILTPGSMHAAFDPNGVEVWCPRANQDAYTNDGFCQFCGATDHKPLAY